MHCITNVALPIKQTVKIKKSDKVIKKKPQTNKDKHKKIYKCNRWGKKLKMRQKYIYTQHSVSIFQIIFKVCLK